MDKVLRVRQFAPAGVLILPCFPCQLGLLAVVLIQPDPYGPLAKGVLILLSTPEVLSQP